MCNNFEKKLIEVDIRRLTKPNLNQTDLINAGITKALITKYLPLPTIKQQHSYNLGDYTTYIYNNVEVIKVVETAEFKDKYIKSYHWQVAAKKRASQRYATMQSNIDNLEISINTDDPLDEITLDAIEAWEKYNRDIWTNIDAESTKRITVNYIRHNLTDYDEWIADNCVYMFGVVDDILCQQLHCRVNECIYTQYPNLRPIDDQ